MIPDAASLWVQLHYPEAVEALAKGIGPLIAEEFDGEEYGWSWAKMSEKDRIVVRFIATRGLRSLLAHCHASAMGAPGQDPKGLEAKPASAAREAGDAHG